MTNLKFFDCNCMIGMRKIMNPGSFYKLEDLLKKMNYYGIAKALVYHAMAREYSPMVGNEILMKEIKEYPNLIPAWVIMHHHTREFFKPFELEEHLRMSNIRAVRMFPSSGDHNYSISEWNCGELFSMLEEKRIPLLIELNQLSWNELFVLCDNHPELRIILTDVDYRIDRNIYALFDKFEHLHIETIGYKVHRGIETIAKTFGARRIIFGSGMPIYSGGSAVSMVNYGDVTEEEKQLIASKNLENLLGGVRL